MTTRSSVLAWEMPWTQEPGGLQSTGSQRVRYDCEYRHTGAQGGEGRLAEQPGAPKPSLQARGHLTSDGEQSLVPGTVGI